MRRELEPEYMDTDEEALGYQAMDHSEANESVVARFLELGGGSCRFVADLGTGPGDIPILLARRTPGGPLIAGIDAAARMLALARKKPEAEAFAGRLFFLRADVKALPFADGSVDGVFSNTILHHIGEPLSFLREAARILRPGGVLLIRDLFRPQTEEEARRLVDLHAAGADDYQRELFLDSFRAALTLEEARACAREAGLGRASIEMSSDRHYTIEIAP
ncbi:MAG: class I SAM-dependent methyltransferase [Planctomycetota bacterium]